MEPREFARARGLLRDGGDSILRFDDTQAHRIRDYPARGADNPAILAGGFPTVIHRAGWEPYPGAGQRRGPGTGQAYRHPDAARHGIGG